MKTFIMSLSLLLSSLGFAESSNPQKDYKNLMSTIAMKRYGGKIRQPNTEKGSVVFVNRQKIVDREILLRILSRLERKFHFTLKTTDENVEASRDTFVIRLEELDRKERIIMAPENGWISLNVKALSDDAPPKIVLNNRFEKEVLRSFAFICGGTCGTEPAGLCRMALELDDLDSIPGTDFALDIEARIVNNMKNTGIAPYRIAKYSEAVAEGWAPQPTNEYQKAIWDKIHELPSKPMKIQFDPAAQKGKVTK